LFGDACPRFQAAAPLFIARMNRSDAVAISAQLEQVMQ
jgi:hypothetical protein